VATDETCAPAANQLASRSAAHIAPPRELCGKESRPDCRDTTAAFQRARFPGWAAFPADRRLQWFGRRRRDSRARCMELDRTPGLHSPVRAGVTRPNLNPTTRLFSRRLFHVLPSTAQRADWSMISIRALRRLPRSRAPMLSSLQPINYSRRDLEREALQGPKQRLLQELLVHSLPNEMRVLTAVHEAAARPDYLA